MNEEGKGSNVILYKFRFDCVESENLKQWVIRQLGHKSIQRYGCSKSIVILFRDN